MRDPESVEMMKRALDMLVTALGLLDEADAPADIGAHIDLARDRLCRTLELADVPNPAIWGAIPKPAA